MHSGAQLPLQQHPNFAAALRLMGTDVHAMELDGAAPVQTIVRFGLRFASRGPVWHNSSTELGSSALRRSGLHLINSDSRDHEIIKSAGFRQVMTPAHVAELSLAGTPEDRLARLKGKWRNSLRRALRAPQEIKREIFDAKRHSWLLAADLRQQMTKKFLSLPHSFVQAYAAANPSELEVVVAYADGEPIAAMVFLVHGSVATYHLGWTSVTGRKLSAHHAILFQAGDYLANQCVERLDLGTVDTVNAAGLARFKIGTGATIRPLGGTWLRMPGC